MDSDVETVDEERVMEGSRVIPERAMGSQNSNGTKSENLYDQSSQGRGFSHLLKNHTLVITAKTVNCLVAQHSVWYRYMGVEG